MATARWRGAPQLRGNTLLGLYLSSTESSLVLGVGRGNERLGLPFREQTTAKLL